MTDIVERLHLFAELDVDETSRDGTLEPDDIRRWSSLMREAATEIERLRAGLEICKQHAGWLTQYAAIYTENNWRDIRLRVEDQTDQLHEDIDKALSLPSPPTQEEGE